MHVRVVADFWGGRVGGAIEESGRGFVFTKGIYHRYTKIPYMLFDTAYAHIHSNLPPTAVSTQWIFDLRLVRLVSASFPGEERPVT